MPFIFKEMYTTKELFKEKNENNIFFLHLILQQLAILHHYTQVSLGVATVMQNLQTSLLNTSTRTRDC